MPMMVWLVIAVLGVGAMAGGFYVYAAAVVAIFVWFWWALRESRTGLSKTH